MAILSIKYDYYTPLSKSSKGIVLYNVGKYNTFDLKHIHLEEKNYHLCHYKSKPISFFSSIFDTSILIYIRKLDKINVT